MMLQPSTFYTRSLWLLETNRPGHDIDSLYVHALRQFGPCPLVINMLPRRHVRRRTVVIFGSSEEQHTLSRREHPSNALYNHTKN